MSAWVLVKFRQTAWVLVTICVGFGEVEPPTALVLVTKCVGFGDARGASIDIQ
jgi:hypothetical protein